MRGSLVGSGSDVWEHAHVGAEDVVVVEAKFDELGCEGPPVAEALIPFRA